ncbi:hypothetical protein [Planomicrobium sp. CPCC 101079]|uniref:hypothetical protein n=1 Tax=Planomicrobium sp. CPCC 101079 TaxID=2599618 RepID=UPI0011B358C8|nr:hypothetical protein [Planomicrobium sp. CPCC 101079]TWT00058.1 hypothetical protein FQV28_18205 [Planomicrobium sp. CPCC 101079]
MNKKILHFFSLKDMEQNSGENRTAPAALCASSQSNGRMPFGHCCLWDSEVPKSIRAPNPRQAQLFCGISVTEFNVAKSK